MPAEPRPSRARVRTNLFRTYRKLDPHALGLTDESVTDADVGLHSTDGRVQLAFGTYSEEGLLRALNAYGSLERLKERGVGTIDLKLDLTDAFHPRIQLFSRELNALVVDVSLSELKGAGVGLTGERAEAKLLYLESILLQHPGRPFLWSRPPLPGQLHPGLSLSQEILELLILVAKRLGTEGLALTPSTFHAARVYERQFQFVDGRAEGIFRALRHAGELRPLWLLSWALELGCVKEAGHAYTWEPAPMLAPLTEPMAEHFADPKYLELAQANEWRKFEIDFDLLRERFPWKVMPDGEPPAAIEALLGPVRR